VLFRWGDPVGATAGSPEFRPDASNSAADQAVQAGNIQHPGEVRGDQSSPEGPRALSNWPDFQPDGRPRSSTVVIRRRDGGVIGT
jgi:secreted PhoX family phosphatase